jgi:hypothetical protein
MVFAPNHPQRHNQKYSQSCLAIRRCCASLTLLLRRKMYTAISSAHEVIAVLKLRALSNLAFEVLSLMLPISLAKAWN